VAPKIYNDPGRVLRIVHEDGEEQRVVVNQVHTDEESGLEKFYDLAAGTYDVEVTTGPGYATRRKEAVAEMAELAKGDPKVMQVADDLVVSQMDFPMAKEIAARLKKTIPPQLLDDGQGADKDTQLAQAQGQLQRVTQEAQALNAHAQQVEQQAQQLAQENQQLKAQAQSKQQEMTVKQDELALKAQHEQATQELDRLKLQLEADKLALERARVQMELHEKQIGLLPAIDGQVQQTQIDTLATMHQQLLALQAHLGETLAALAQVEAERRAPKTLALHRDAGGTLVGEVQDHTGQVVRRLALARHGTGFQGETQ
jgi:hypothetical protein